MLLSPSPPLPSPLGSDADDFGVDDDGDSDGGNGIEKIHFSSSENTIRPGRRLRGLLVAMLCYVLDLIYRLTS